jgi:hypothetical protein
MTMGGFLSWFLVEVEALKKGEVEEYNPPSVGSSADMLIG